MVGRAFITYTIQSLRCQLCQPQFQHWVFLGVSDWCQKKKNTQTSSPELICKLKLTVKKPCWLLTCHLSQHHGTHQQSEECCGLHSVLMHQCWCVRILLKSLQPAALLPLAMWHSTSEFACQARERDCISTRLTQSSVKCPIKSIQTNLS